MIYTSHYRSPKLRKDMNLIAISYLQPPDIMAKFDIGIYKPLCPTKKLVMDYKHGLLTVPEYTTLYYEQVLEKLDPYIVCLALNGNAVLLCWEKPFEFCHRHLVAEWLNNNLNCGVREL